VVIPPRNVTFVYIEDGWWQRFDLHTFGTAALELAVREVRALVGVQEVESQDKTRKEREIHRRLYLF
jgi:hypothetical protein